MPIQILAPAVANQIAAGEVVERPASAVKELIENSLDAGATEIRVEIREGGRRLIRIQDDGSGIPAGDTGLLFQRHATSKIHSAADLDRLTTLGFRGEALASIGSVAQVTLLTCARNETTATLLHISGGAEISREARGAPPGTTITVEHLFANVPARLKFLKQPATEAGHVLQIVTRYALAYPDRRFSLVSDGKLVFQSSGNGKLYDVLVKVYGLDVAKQMIEIEPVQVGEAEGSSADAPGDKNEGEPGQTGAEQTSASSEGQRAAPREPGDPLAAPTPSLHRARPATLKVTGYVGVPGLHRSNRSYITLFVNRRWFQDNSLAYGVIQAYHTLLPVGRYPLALIFIEMDPAEVDVNVHPAKAEVRFRDNHTVFGAVQRAVRRILTDQAPIPEVGIGGYAPAPTAEPLPVQLSWDDPAAWALRRQALLGAGHTSTRFDPAEPEDAEVVEGEEPPAVEWPPMARPPQQTAPKIPLLRVVGQVAAMYLVAEGPDGMYLIDQHAAHERILYEQMLAGHTRQDIPVQPLLSPVVLELSPEQAATVADEIETLRELGATLEPFGGSSYLLRSIPAILSRENPQSALVEIIDGLMDRTDVVSGAREAQLITLICKRAAVKGGKVLTMVEMQEMVRQLEQCQSPRTCPHGRPTMVHVSAAELARQFGRL